MQELIMADDGWLVMRHEPDGIRVVQRCNASEMRVERIRAVMPNVTAVPANVYVNTTPHRYPSVSLRVVIGNRSTTDGGPGILQLLSL